MALVKPRRAPKGDVLFRDIVAYARSGARFGCGSKERKRVHKNLTTYLQRQADLEAANLTTARIAVRRHNAIERTAALIRKILVDTCLAGGKRKRVTEETPNRIAPLQVEFAPLQTGARAPRKRGKKAAAKRTRKPKEGRAPRRDDPRLTLPPGAPNAARGHASWFDVPRRTSMPAAPPGLPDDELEPGPFPDMRAAADEAQRIWESARLPPAAPPELELEHPPAAARSRKGKGKKKPLPAKIPISQMELDFTDAELRRALETSSENARRAQHELARRQAIGTLRKVQPERTSDRPSRRPG